MAQGYHVTLSAVHPWEPVQVSPNLKFEAQPYGWDLVPDHGEWQLTFRGTARQDGRVSWLMVLTEVDGEVKTLNSLDAYERTTVNLQRAILNLTAHFNDPFAVAIKFES